jgi:hypothetical protein
MRSDSVDNKEDFIKFVKFLRQELKNEPSYWQNTDLGSFLEAMAGWTEDMEGYYINNNLSVPSNINWKFIADTLTAATMYE